MFKSLGGMSSPKVKEFLMQETAQLNKAWKNQGNTMVQLPVFLPRQFGFSWIFLAFFWVFAVCVAVSNGQLLVWVGVPIVGHIWVCLNIGYQ
jgi:hypothetical protein